MKCFKAYDIRGVVPDDLDADLAYDIGRAYATFIKPTSMEECRIVVGYDIRPSGKSLLVPALISGLMDSGVDVIDIGHCGTEQVYFATFFYNYEGGIMVTASHNPPEYNGMKMVGKKATPIGMESGLQEIANIIKDKSFIDKRLVKYMSEDHLKKYGVTNKISTQKEWDVIWRSLPDEAFSGKVIKKDISREYVDYILGKFVFNSDFKNLKIVCNPGNGMADIALQHMPSEISDMITKIHSDPLGSFPNGIPNPLLRKNRHTTSEAVKKYKANFGVAWDGDFDRCFFFDENGDFVESYYVIGLVMEFLSSFNNKLSIVYEPRLILNTLDVAKRLPIKTDLNISKSGHSFIKKTMRDNNADFGGEISGHYYFKNFSYCDSGIIPFLLMIQILSRTDKTLSELIKGRKEKYPISGELNIKVSDPNRLISEIERIYRNKANKSDRNVISYDISNLDGLSVFILEKYTNKSWAFNIRPSNTEPLVRLCIETHNDKGLLKLMIDSLLTTINKFGGEMTDS